MTVSTCGLINKKSLNWKPIIFLQLKPPKNEKKLGKNYKNTKNANYSSRIFLTNHIHILNHIKVLGAYFILIFKTLRLCDLLCSWIKLRIPNHNNILGNDTTCVMSHKYICHIKYITPLLHLLLYKIIYAIKLTYLVNLLFVSEMVRSNEHVNWVNEVQKSNL